MDPRKEVRTLLSNSDIFKGLPASAIRELSGHMVTARFKKDSVILEKNTTGDWMYLIRSGQVKVHDGPLVLAILGEGDVIGELSLLKPEVRSMSVTTLEDTLVYTISHNDFFSLAEKNPKALFGIIGVLVDRIRNQNATTIQHFELREQELTRQVEERTRDLYLKNQELESTQRYKEQFLANMSHEIRTPMNAILGMSNLVLDSELNDKQRNYLKSIHKASENLLILINDILDFSKVEAGKLELEQIDFSLGEVISQVRDTLSLKAEEKGIELHALIMPDVPDILVGDPVRLYQILMNLAGNAVKFTDKGSVQIEVNKTSEGDQFICLKFSIIDTGIGIPADKIESIFELFSQAHTSDTRKYGGTGLGLSISKQLTELMGGELTIESVEGSGSTFAFVVPMTMGSVEKLQHRQTSGKIDGQILNGLRILLVDDDKANRVVARDTLESKAEVSIMEAVNGRDAIDQLAKNDFDIVLMDVQMPVMDGYEATRYIRSHIGPPTNQIPIIALTASVIRSDLDKCRAAGMDDFVPKPFKTRHLLATIAQLTGREIKFLGEEKTGKKTNQATAKQYVDLSYLESFCEGNQSKMQKYVQLYLDSAPVLLTQLENALTTSSFQEIASQVHGFKTKFVMMGMHYAGRIAKELEARCRIPDPDTTLIHQQTCELITCVTMANEELKNHNNNLLLQK